MIMVLKNRVIVGCLLLVVGLLNNSCNKPSSNFDDSQVFRYNEHSNIQSLDPAFAKDVSDIWATNQLFNGLVQLDDSLNVQPAIAKSWNISEDGLTYTFTLRMMFIFISTNCLEQIVQEWLKLKILNTHLIDY